MATVEILKEIEIFGFLIGLKTAYNQEKSWSSLFSNWSATAVIEIARLNYN